MTNSHAPILIDPADLRPDQVKMLLYGDMGQGKTTLAATAPHCLMLSVEGGEQSLSNPAHPLDPRSRIHRVYSMDDLRAALWWIQTNQYGFGEFESVVIDSLTDVQERCLSEIMIREEAKNPSRKKGRPQQQDWQETTYVMRRMASAYRDLPKHVIFVALYRKDGQMDGMGGSSSRPVRAQLSPSVYQGVAGYVDITAYMTTAPLRDAAGQPTGKAAYYLILEDPNNQISVKKRWRQLPPWIQDPTFSKLLAGMQGVQT